MEEKYLLGVDIGGTKCAVCAGKVTREGAEVVEKIKFPTRTDLGCAQALERLTDAAVTLGKKYPIRASGVSCGSPLDIKRGLIMEPPNLPSWKGVPIVDMLEKALGVPSAIRNDADACALAEYRWGAGRGSENMAFLTFGTGMGAGLVLNGKLYVGKSGTAGEVGHLRLREDGPVGYGKRGSFEGFCSGGGIAQLAERAAEGDAKYAGMTLDAKTAAELAYAGDAKMRGVYDECARMLGRGLAVLADVLDLDVIVLGSIYVRSKELLYDGMMKSLREEALPYSLEGLKILPAQLGESLGDAAALAVAEVRGNSEE